MDIIIDKNLLFEAEAKRMCALEITPIRAASAAASTRRNGWNANKNWTHSVAHA